MRRISFTLLILSAMAISYALGRRHATSRTAGKAGRTVLYYVDPMHPAYRSQKPGKSPDCGMPLEPVYADAVGRGPSPGLALWPEGAVSIDGATQRLLGIRLARAETGAALGDIRVVGRVVPEDTRVYKVNAGAEGFVRETYNDSVGLFVRKDQKLASYYGPEFLSVVSGFLAATERVPATAANKDGNRTMSFPGAVSKQGFSSVEGYADRLRNLGMSDVQIGRIAENRQLPDSIEVVAPADGFILARDISAGQHFEPNAEFYRIADLTRVWVVAEVYEQDAKYVRPGDSAHIRLRDEGRELNGRIAESLPQFEASGGSIKLRLELDNPGYVLRPDMLVDVDLAVRLPPALTVPVDAVVDSGARARVYVQNGEDVFVPREVETGWRFGERVEILHGLQAGDRVVDSAAFLVDSESRLRNQPERLAAAGEPGTAQQGLAAAKTAKDPSCGMPVNSAAAAAAGNVVAYRGTTYYFCSPLCKDKFQSKATASVTKPRDTTSD
jgi:Cu(I)/Ag(I) efflux system membrane fusion protein